MKRSSGPHKTASNLPDSVHQQLNMYTLAAGAAGVGALALAQAAEAKIVYTPANVVIGLGGVQTYHLDLNKDGVADFSIDTTHRGYACGNRGTLIFGLFEKGVARNGAMGRTPLAAALSAGASIGPAQRFFGAKGTMAYYRHNYGGHCHPNEARGYWQNVNARYLGLIFKISGQFHYGWARLNVTRHRLHGFTATLTGYAYETIPGKAIVAGKTVADEYEDDFGPGASLTNPIPDKQPPSLGMLALGAQGVPLWRRKESALQGDLKGGL
jgi:hypothetical protein